MSVALKSDVRVFSCVVYALFAAFISTHTHARAAERIFIWGDKDQKGHCNVKKGTNGVHADNYH